MGGGPTAAASAACGCGATGPMREIYVRHGCPILRCAACGAGRSLPARFDPTSYYTADYFEGGHADGYGDYAATREVLAREFGAVARRLRAALPEGRVLLEIGCAYGYFLRVARDAGWEAHGLEISADAVARCHAEGLPVVTQGVADATALAGLPRPDAVVMLDVIEHLPDPLDTLALCAGRLRAGGVIHVSTGDFASPLARLLGPRWRLMTPPQHLWFLTPEWFRRAAPGIGLAVESVSHPWKTVPLSLALFQLRRFAGLAPRAVARAPRPARAWASRLGLPVNLFDAMHVVLRKPAA